jgi:2-iminobutanoate/2-iminopropanoate deaminase
MDREVISGSGLPKQIGPYSQAVRAGGFVYVSGQPGVHPETGAEARPTFAEQAKQAFANLDAVLRAAGSRPELVVSTTVRMQAALETPEAVALEESHGVIPPISSFIEGQ